MADKEEEKQENKEKKEKKEKKGKKENKEEKGEKESQKSEGIEKKSFVARFLPKIIMAAVVLVFAGAGFTLGRIFAGSSVPQSNESFANGPSPDLANIQANGSEEDLPSWYYNLEPVIANLNVADVTRYVKASLILEVSSEVDEKKGTAFLDEKKPVLTNWLNVYLASLGLDDIRGDSNLKRIQSQILDAFNEKLFPDSKPMIKHILFKEFAVQ
jgi:flagellar basal body-associated protein FliL